MTLTVVKPGLQTTLQGAPFSGHRHLGMPAAGAADCLSVALANRLVGNPLDATAIEITLDDAKFTVGQANLVALTGAACFLRINGKDRPVHSPIPVTPGDEIHIGPSDKGCRSYLAVAGQIAAQSVLGNQSTYLGAKLGGYEGRTLKTGDKIKINEGSDVKTSGAETPSGLRPIMSKGHIIRITIGPEYSALSHNAQKKLFDKKFTIGARANRMGLALQSTPLEQHDGPQMKSAPVFPGTIQCPPDGEPFLLGPDAQTTGGYPRIAQVIRADRHLIGQLRPGSDVQFVRISPVQATEIYRQKLALLTPWLGAVSLW
ncbi:5-oxoprolinase subunit PxpC [Parasphingorhabdus litoris]|uniref:5-oxoprolinase subunit PxpC n=1 Tax=Parasphingorhabdus litoris TaxID=394733 RepID=A0ABP3KH16_9SPHN|nr:biotin-dependent carboxyltransferase family protein [Parasphingorhabdus litoris]